MVKFKHYPCKIIHGDTVRGKIVYYNESAPFLNATKANVNILYKELYEVIDDEFNQHQTLEAMRAKTKGDVRDIHGFVHWCFDKQTIMLRFKELMYNDKLNIKKAFNKAIDEFLIQNPNALKEEHTRDQKYVYETFDYLRKRLSERFEMIGLQKMTKRRKSAFILVVNKLKKEQFFNLSKHITGIICKSIDDEKLGRTLASEYEITIAVSSEKYVSEDMAIIDSRNSSIIIDPTNQQITEYDKVIEETTYKIGEKASYKPSKIKIYAPMNDIRLIDRISSGNWYSGVAPFKSEFIYVSKGSLVGRSEQYKVFYKLLKTMDEGEVYIRIPDFRPERPTEYLGNIYTDIDTYREFEGVYAENMLAIAQAARETERVVNIVIPMVRTNGEINIWRDIIETFFHGILHLVNVGIMIETESAIDYFEDYKDMDFAIIDLNDMIEEVTDDFDRFSSLTKEEILEIFWPDLRDLHQYLRDFKLKITHMLSGNFLSNPKLFSKFMIAGFTNYSIPSNKVRLIEDVLRNYVDTRGYYKGVAAERKRRKDYRKRFPETKEIPIENDIKRENAARAQLRRIEGEYKQKNEEILKREQLLKEILEENKIKVKI